MCAHLQRAARLQLLEAAQQVGGVRAGRERQLSQRLPGERRQRTRQRRLACAQGGQQQPRS